MNFDDRIYIVCDEINVNNRKSTKLIDVYDCDDWRLAVKNANCCEELYLVESTYEEFLSLPNAEVLSYRWRSVITITCKVYSPGDSNPSEERTSEISLDIFRKLKTLRNSHIWIDYLSHLNNEEHKKNVIQKMGTLYVYGNVYPLYLQDYLQDYLHKHEDDDSEDLPKLLELSLNDSSYSLSSSLRRGWIQQEISFGQMQKDIVLEFVKTCIKSKDYRSLGTLIRRRAKALEWAFELFNSISKFTVDLVKPDSDDSDYINPDPPNIEYLLDISSGFFGISPSLEVENNVYMCIGFLVESQTSESFINDLVSNICVSNDFDPSNKFSAQQLLRSFAGSDLKYEEDAYIAMIQCPAILCGIKSLNFLKDPYVALLRRCWLSILQSQQTFAFTVNRKREEDCVLGLYEVLPILKDAVVKQHDYLLIKVGKREIIFELRSCSIKDNKALPVTVFVSTSDYQKVISERQVEVQSTYLDSSRPSTPRKLGQCISLDIDLLLKLQSESLDMKQGVEKSLPDV